MGGRLEKAGFWVAVAGASAGIAALGLAVGVVNVSGTHFREPWFGIGVVFGAVAIIALVVALIMYFLHGRDGGGEKQPDRPPPAPSTAGVEIDIPAGSTIQIGPAKIVLSEGTKLRVDGTLDGVQR
jgi:hypothetical protein